MQLASRIIYLKFWSILNSCIRSFIEKLISVKIFPMPSFYSIISLIYDDGAVESQLMAVDDVALLLQSLLQRSIAITAADAFYSVCIFALLMTTHCAMTSLPSRWRQLRSSGNEDDVSKFLYWFDRKSPTATANIENASVSSQTDVGAVYLNAQHNENEFSRGCSRHKTWQEQKKSVLTIDSSISSWRRK